MDNTTGQENDNEFLMMQFPGRAGSDIHDKTMEEEINELTVEPGHTEELSREGGVWKLISEGLPSDDNSLCLFISWKDEWKSSYASYFGTIEQAKNHREYDLKNHYTHYMIIQPPKK